MEAANGRAFHVRVDRLPAAAGDSWIVHVAMDRTLEEELLRNYRKGLAFVLCLALLFCTIVGYQIAKRGMRPVHKIAAAARQIRSTTLGERIDGRGLPAELSTLADTFNGMLDRLQNSFERLTRFSADIAHELRTPVNNLRGEVEVALGRSRTPDEYRDVLGSALEECERLAQLIDSLLFLARAERPETSVVKERVDIGNELATVREYYEVAAADAGVQLDVDVATPLTADVDRTLLQRAVSNLVANAVAHTPPGGRVRLASFRDNGRVVIEVADSGAGIPANHLPHVFDRFYRVDDARSSKSGGVGLGLAIVKSIAAMHGGSAAIESMPGKGTTVRLEFPNEDPRKASAPMRSRADVKED
jgi:two-component system heavy metal sensor histidine kinase CusS